MNIVNLSTLKLNDSHNYYGGAIGNIAYELLSHLARRPGVTVYSTVEGADLERDPPPDLHLREVSGLRDHRRIASKAAPDADVLTHLYFHEPEYSPVLDIIDTADAPFVLGMVEAPHRRFADELHGMERIAPLRRVAKRVFMRYHRKTLQAADTAVYVTQDARRHYREHVSGADGPVIPYGVDTDRFTPGNGVSDTPRILVVSRLIRRRGIQHLLKALPVITLRVPDVEVDIIGEGAYEADLKALAREQIHITNHKRDTPRVMFHGNVMPEELVERYRSADVLCHLSCDDGWNQPALEAMACGAPVVATDEPHNPMVVDGVTGRRVPWDEPGAVAEAVSGLLASPERCFEYGRQARGLVEREYDWKRIARGYERVFQCVLET